MLKMLIQSKLYYNTTLNGLFNIKLTCNVALVMWHANVLINPCHNGRNTLIKAVLLQYEEVFV